MSTNSENKKNKSDNNSISSHGSKKQKEEANDENKITIVPFKNVFLKICKGNHYYILDR